MLSAESAWVNQPRASDSAALGWTGIWQGALKVRLKAFDHRDYRKRLRALAVLLHRAASLDARHQQCGEEVLASICFFDRDLRHVAGRCQNEIGMFYPVVPSVSHSDDERHERLRV
jgi:hypothetical protein